MKDYDIIKRALEAIAADDNAKLVARALTDAWDGRSFDEEALGKSFSELRVPEDTS
jgi:hypothetical protein